LSAILAKQLEQVGRKYPKSDATSMMAELIGALTLARAEPDAERSAAILEVSRNALKSRFGLEPAA
jgi:TetR/AcrR family transcriptional repressor of nem operon